MKVPTYNSPRVARVSGAQAFVRNGAAASTGSAELGNSLIQSANMVGNVGGLLKQQADAAIRFGQLQSFSAFGSGVDEQMAEMKRNADPSQGNFAEQATATYDKWEQDWLKTVPDNLHDEFATRSAEKKAAISRDALTFQYESTDTYFRNGLTDQLNLSLRQLNQDGSVANLDLQRASIDEYIASTTLSEAEKVALRRQSYSSIEVASYKAERRRRNLDAGALGVGSAPGKAVDLLLQFDGASLENGLDYETNRELLGIRVRDAEEAAVATVGNLDRWAVLPDRARSALISLVDDLGEMPDSVKQAIDSGDLENVAAAIADLSGTQGDRRMMEAQIVLGTEEMPEGQLDADPRFANISYEDRLALRADAETEAASIQAEETRAAKAVQDAAINDLTVRLFDGNAGQYELDNAREEGWLTNYSDITRAQGILDKRNEDLILTQSMSAMLANGITINPDDADHRKAFNAYVGNQGLAALQGMDQQYVTSVLVPASRTAGDLPTQAVGTLTGMMRSRDPKRALFALDTLSQLEQASPEAYSARVDEATAADVAYWQDVKDYYPQEEVLAAVRVGTTQEERTRRSMLMEEAQGLLKDGTVPSDILGTIAPRSGQLWWAKDPVMAEGTAAFINDDYQQLFQREYARDGDAGKAQERAQKALARVWKTTEIGGQPTLMRYPPELAGYKTWNGSHDWINEQARADMGLAPDQNFRLMSDEQTKSELAAFQRGEGPPPSYNAVYWDDRGELAVPTTIVGAKGEEQYVPQRLYFQITESMNAEKSAQLAEQTARQGYDRAVTTFQNAQRHSLHTGVPIPQDIQDDYDEAVEQLGTPRSTMSVFGNWGTK